MFGYGEAKEELFLPIPHLDPVVLEFNRLQNLLKEKDKELEVAQGEIKSLRASESLKTKAVDELENELAKLDEKLGITETLLEQKNLEIKRLKDEKKSALAAQFAAEATLRRVHANQKDDDAVPIESIIAPLEADIKKYKNEVASLLEDKKALERLTKSKEAALLETEKILRSALERALIVEEIQNLNLELRRQVEICQEENRILEKTNRQKVVEVEKLSLSIRELEEAILAGGAAANVVRDCKRQISELSEEKRTLERELARAKVSANRVATVVANEWKGENDKVMPVKQWLEERKLFQAEIQRLRDKLTIAERTAKAEAQLKDKMKLRLKTLEEGLKHIPSFSMNPKSSYCSPKTPKSNHILGFLSNNAGLRKRSTSQPRTRASALQQPVGAAEGLRRGGDSPKKHVSGGNMLRRGLWASRSKVVDTNTQENAEMIGNTASNAYRGVPADDDKTVVPGENDDRGNEESQSKGSANFDGGDVVSGFLYDRLQKEVICLRKSCEEKESSLNAKNEEIQMLVQKVDALTTAIEVESSKAKREITTKEKETILAKMDDNQKISNNIFLKRVTEASRG
ncbi:hypothetical protein Ancab_033365 [Ancistrocladus abbreviatus]